MGGEGTGVGRRSISFLLFFPQSFAHEFTYLSSTYFSMCPSVNQVSCQSFCNPFVNPPIHPTVYSFIM